MNLPPRVKTQFPKTSNIPTEVITPIPIETVFFLEDGKQDRAQSNRYYFNYPGNWATSNNGESIIGLRSIKIQRHFIKLKFTIELAKYLKENYENRMQPTHNDTINFLLQEDVSFAHKESLTVLWWIKPSDYDYTSFFNAVDQTLQYYLSKKWFKIPFEQDPNLLLNKDIQFEGYHDQNGYHVKIYTERSYNDKDEWDVSFKITAANDEFKDLFNYEITDTWEKEILFNKVWDLKPCNVYSSFGDIASHHYIGISDVDYPAIKYFKLNSSDQDFWIEFRSMGHYSYPSYFPKRVSFAIEIQFQSFNKRLNT